MVDEAVVVEAAQLLEVDEGARAVVVIEVDEAVVAEAVAHPAEVAERPVEDVEEPGELVEAPKSLSSPIATKEYLLHVPRKTCWLRVI